MDLNLSGSAHRKAVLMCKTYLIASVKSIGDYDKEMPQ